MVGGLIGLNGHPAASRVMDTERGLGNAPTLPHPTMESTVLGYPQSLRRAMLGCVRVSTRSIPRSTNERKKETQNFM